MCGVIGCVFEKNTTTLGQTATRLLQMLEYRGYDSTGGIIQDDHGRITLKKDVGAPSEVAVRLGIDKLAGRIFCGQVRWATFGVVSRENAQPHEMKCKLHFYGAHNGNITNCERLKEWLKREGHDVKSDNDGEMLVHTIEHFFAEELRYKDFNDREVRHEALRQAMLRTSSQVVGSFASVVVDPVSGLMAVIKAGSSLYLGRGTHPSGGAFHLASSDLASVLQLTRVLIPIREKEFAIFDAQRFTLYDLRNGRKIKRPSQRSLLKVEETRLDPAYTFFMEQEIHQQVSATRRLIARFDGGDSLVARIRKVKADRDLVGRLQVEVAKLAEKTDVEELAPAWRAWLESPGVQALMTLANEVGELGKGRRLESSHGAFLEELRELADFSRYPDLEPMLACLDAAFDLLDVEDLEKRLRKFVQIMRRVRESRGSIYMLACGSSFHAGKTAPLFFNEIAGIPVVPLLPGEFRAQCTKSLREEDVIIGISQSGETKDLIDVFNFVAEEYPRIKRICILNNTNSTLAQEKSDLYIPLYCGPEISVPATKSFMSQLLVLFMLAVRVRESSLPKTRSSKTKPFSDQTDFWEMVERVPDLIDRTIKTTKKEVDEIAGELFIRPSIHILATRLLGIAKEGALKIREIVLNHTEGFEGAEFKHGPNTILGVNTVFGMDSVQALLRTICDSMKFSLDQPEMAKTDGQGLHRLFRSVVEFALEDTPPNFLTTEEKSVFDRIFSQHNFFRSLYRNYPLVFLTSPQETDINLTISQINTHKIRGADVFMIAEDNEHLREAVSMRPAGDSLYRHGYVTLPRTDSPILAIFSMTTVLQLLALQMSMRKMEFLDRLEICEHGVHPDVPKNVSKSITVD